MILVLWQLICPVPLKPHTLCFYTLQIRVNSFTMHFAFFPRPLILASITPCECPSPMPQILWVLAFIAAPVRPLIQAEPIHVVIHPFARVNSAIIPRVSSLTLHLVVDPVALVNGLIRPFINPKTILFAIGIQTRKYWAILPLLLPLSMVNIVLPLTNICLRWCYQTSVPCSLILKPVTLVGVPILQE